ncbi:MAG: ArsR/SmtB family transcription factor [Solirubrobacterales bacterium]
MPHSPELRSVLFHGFSDPRRLAIVEQLAGGELRVSDIVAATGLSQPSVSTHLGCLWECGLLARERRGREVHYRLIDGVDELLGAADSVLDRAGHTVGACPKYGHGRRAAAA